MTNFTWKIDNLKVYSEYENQQNVVFRVFYSCKGIDADNEDMYSVWTSRIRLPITVNENFTPFDQLTEQQVLDWIWTNGVDKTDIESKVQIDIDYKKAPVIKDLPTPWNQSPQVL
jgi:hypothetical protein